MPAEAGIVSNAAQIIRNATFQLIAKNFFDRPTPRIAEAKTCVVLVGNPKAEAPRITLAEAVSTQKP